MTRKAWVIQCPVCHSEAQYDSKQEAERVFMLWMSSMYDFVTKAVGNYLSNVRPKF
jgi:hypothetical protein